MGTNTVQLCLLDEERLQRPGEPDDALVASIAARTIRELAEEPPIDLEVVASFRGITDIRREELESAGSLTPEEVGLVMRLRRGDSHRRQRFTGFHEITHTFQAGYREQTLFRCAPSYRRRDRRLDPETLSDIGAAELLLPAEHFAHDLAGCDFGIKSVIDLSERYDASVQATAYRLAALWPEPVLIVNLEPGLRKSELGDPSAEKRLRVVNAWSDRPELWPFVRTNKSADDDSPLLEALGSGGTPIEAECSLEELAGESPEGLELSAQSFSYRNRDGEIIERVMAIYRAPT